MQKVHFRTFASSIGNCKGNERYSGRLPRGVCTCQTERDIRTFSICKNIAMACFICCKSSVCCFLFFSNAVTTILVWSVLKLLKTPSLLPLSPIMPSCSRNETSHSDNMIQKSKRNFLFSGKIQQGDPKLEEIIQELLKPPSVHPIRKLTHPLKETAQSNAVRKIFKQKVSIESIPTSSTTWKLKLWQTYKSTAVDIPY